MTVPVSYPAIWDDQAFYPLHEEDDAPENPPHEATTRYLRDAIAARFPAWLDVAAGQVPADREQPPLQRALVHKDAAIVVSDQPADNAGSTLRLSLPRLLFQRQPFAGRSQGVRRRGRRRGSRRIGAQSHKYCLATAEPLSSGRGDVADRGISF